MLFDKNKIEYIEGFGSVTDDGNVKIGGQFDGTEIEADKVVLAVGSVPKPLLDLEFGGRVLDTAGTWLLGERPARLCVIGAGASGTEVASAFGRLGTEVLLLEALEQILPLEDKEIAKACAREIAKQNVRIETGAKVEGAEASDDGVSRSASTARRRSSTTCASPPAARPTWRASASTRPASSATTRA